MMTEMTVAVVTAMQGTQVCIGCLDASARWLRPEPRSGTLTEELIASAGSYLAPGHVIRAPLSPKPRLVPPHTEDVVCDMQRHQRVRTLTLEQFGNVLTQSLAASLAEGFRGHLLRRAVLPGSPCPSLVTVRGRRVTLTADYHGTPKFRLELDDGDHLYASIPVRDLRLMKYLHHRMDLAREPETDFHNSRLRHSQSLVCLGLARPWARPGDTQKCWLQANGVFTFPEDFLSGYQWHHFSHTTAVISLRQAADE